MPFFANFKVYPIKHINMNAFEEGAKNGPYRTLSFCLCSGPDEPSLNELCRTLQEGSLTCIGCGSSLHGTSDLTFQSDGHAHNLKFQDASFIIMHKQRNSQFIVYCVHQCPLRQVTITVR